VEEVWFAPVEEVWFAPVEEVWFAPVEEVWVAPGEGAALFDLNRDVNPPTIFSPFFLKNDWNMFENATKFNNGQGVGGTTAHMNWIINFINPETHTPTNFSYLSPLTLAPTGNSPFLNNGD
jgi:hypothetical protein